ncbi:hypothetical protein ACRAWG_23060 [Methylobacterium sp. P31]
MHSRHDRAPKTFGKRRPLDEPGELALVPRSRERHRAFGRPVGLLAWAVRMSAVLGFVAVIAAYQLAHLDPSGSAPARVALDGRTLPPDPETTGAILPSAAARATRLDPCVMPVSDRLRP